MGSLNDMVKYLDTVSKRLTSTYRANIERLSRYALNALTEFRSLVSQLEIFLKKAQCLYETLCKGSVNCRLCHRWLFTTISEEVILKKLNPLIVLLLGKDGLYISINAKGVKLTPKSFELRLNEVKCDVAFDDDEKLRDNLSIIINTLSDIRNAISRGVNDLELCCREHALTC